MRTPSVTLRENQPPSAEKVPGARSLKKELLQGFIVSAIVEGLKEGVKAAVAVL